jgi:pSer/pThr/pTyr-binding forkhead associated (FHA) protein
MLLVEKGKASQSTLKLSPGREYDIGRDPQADLVLEGSRVSGTHARIRFMENGFTIVDMNSTNGLFVNGRREQHFRLQHNDRVAIGDAVLVFKQVDTQRS